MPYTEAQVSDATNLILNTRDFCGNEAAAIADYWDSAVHRLLPVVFAELRKPLYEGVTFDDTAWTAAAEVLDMEIQHAIDTKNAQ